MKNEILLVNQKLRGLANHLKLLLVLFAVLLTSSLSAQSVVKGKVTDADGTGIPGVNVIIKGTTTGTATDADGAFSMSIPDGTADPVLVFSFIGYTSQEQQVSGRSSIDVKMIADTKELNEIVVVGYGTQLKRDITGAIVKVQSDVLQQTASYNVIDQLKGHAAGVDIISASAVPGGESQIRIRGSRTMVANTQTPTATSATTDAGNANSADGPLLVVDGIPYSGNLNDISPSDIASLEILKDASATAIYGSRGAGGVILVTTKRGTSGKTVFSYDGYYGTSKVMKELRVFNGAEFAQFKKDANYALTPAEQAAQAANVSTDWQKLIYQNAPITNHNLNVTGGSDKSKYSMGANYFKQGGIIPNQDYTRYTLRSTMDHQLSNRIKVGINTINTVSYQNTPGGSGVASGLMRLTPLASPYNPDGTVNLLPQVGGVDANVFSPLTLKSNSGALLSRTRRLRTFNSLYGEVDIIKGLKYRINVGLDYYQDKSDSYLGPNVWGSGTSLQSQSQASMRNSENWQYTVENLLLYEKTLNEKHKIGFTGLYSFQKNHYQTSYVTAIGVPLDIMQNTNFYPAQSTTVGGQYDNVFQERGLISYMGRLTYSYDGRLSATATFRTDGSSVLSPGNQYYSYPALAAAWNITNEKFMAGTPVISNLKLRAGWGVTANQNINPYSTLGALGTSVYNFGQGASGQQVGFNLNSLPNNSLKWQSTSQWNVGLDFGIIENRITGAIEVYNQQTSNILLPISLPPTNGAGTTFTNAGKTKGNGMEISINTINIKKDNGFIWTTEFNYFFNREQIVALSTPSSDPGNGWFIGQPLNVIYDYKKIGIWQTGDPGLTTQTSPTQQAGQIKVLDWNTAGAVKKGDTGYGVADNKITPDDRMILGNFQPKFDAGLSTKVAYKGFDLSMSFYARMGMKVVVPYVTSEPAGSNYTGYSFFNQARVNQLKVDYWTPTNPTNAYPQPNGSLGVPFYSSTLGYVDGSFIKCRTINLGYNIPAAFLGKAGISSLRVYVSAINPFVIWAPFVQQGYGPDPEGNGYGGAINAQGTTNAGTPGRQVTVNANNPATRQFMLGLNLKF